MTEAWYGASTVLGLASAAILAFAAGAGCLLGTVGEILE
jgi:hypothetical protein